MYARAAELTEILSLVRRGRSVAVTGLHGSGRSEIIRRAVGDLEATGVRVVGRLELDELQSRSAFSGGGAQMRGGEQDRRVSALRKELAAAVHAVVVLDDVDLMDEASRHVARSVLPDDVPLLVSSAPGGPRLSDLLPGVRTTVNVLPLAPLSLEAVADLLGADFDMRAEPQLVARLTMKSAGNPGLVGAIVESARRAGLITREADTWRMVGSSLWHRSLSGDAERILGALSEVEYEAIHGLALAAGATLAQCLQFASAEAMTALSRRSLVTVIGSGPGASRITVSPPLLSDYFRHLPRSVERELILSRMPGELRSRVQVAELGASTVVPAAAGDETENSDAAIVRFFEEQAVSDERVRWEMWRGDHSLENGLRYLELGFTSHPDPARLKAVVDQTRLVPGGSEQQIVEFVTYQGLIRGLLSGTSDEAIDTFASARRKYPALAAEMAADEALVTVLLDGATLPRDEDLATLLASATSARARAAIQAAIALKYAIAGDGGRALAAVAGIEGETGPLVDLVGELASSLARYSLGRLSQMLESSGRGLARAKTALDRPGIIVHGYVAVLALVRLGMWADAERVLGFLLSLGQPPRIFVWMYASMARVAALLAARSGNPGFAEELVEMADRLGPTTSMLPGAQPEISSAVLSLIANDDRAAARAMVDGAEKCEERGYLLSSVSLLLYAICLDPTLEDVESLERVERSGDRSHAVLAAFAKAVITNPADAPSRARDYQIGSDVFLAVLVLRTLAERETGDESPYAAALAILEERSNWVRPDPYFPNETEVALALTGRELEIARLAGTMTNAEIAALLHVSVSTVANHISSALKKTGLTSRREMFELIRRQASLRN